jgi:hypothetical protein
VGRGEEPASRTASQEQRPPAAAVKVEGAGSREEPASRTAAQERRKAAAVKRAGEFAGRREELARRTASQEQRPPAQRSGGQGKAWEGGRSPHVELLLKSKVKAAGVDAGSGEVARKVDLLLKRSGLAQVAVVKWAG